MEKMLNIGFPLALAVVLGILFAWGFRHLAHERWQIMACLPMRKLPDGQWQAVNLTYYGLINATACVVSALLVFVLLSAAGLPAGAIGGLLGGCLALCLTAAKLMARWVEKKAHTFSVGGASFTGFIVTPWIVAALGYLPPAIWPFGSEAVLPVTAALAIGYTLGEGIGRLACLSFGCCYGRRIDRLPPLLRRIFAPFSIHYTGATKKIAYAHNMAGFRTIAVQPITSVLYTAAALVGCLLFLYGQAPAALLVCVLVTQIWRILSEFLRADFRGNGRISAYQFMAAFVCLYCTGLCVLLPSGDMGPLDPTIGLYRLWYPAVILTAQAVWIVVFIYLGVSRTTAATVHVFVRKERI